MRRMHESGLDRQRQRQRQKQKASDLRITAGACLTNGRMEGHRRGRYLGGDGRAPGSRPGAGG